MTPASGAPAPVRQSSDRAPTRDGMQCNDPGSDSHSIRSPDSRLQTPPRLCSLPTVMCAHCVCATGTGRRRRGRGRRSTHSWSYGTTPRLHGSGTRILEPAAHLMTYDDLSDGFPLMASLARCMGCRISKQLPGIYHDRRFLAGKGYRAYWRRCGAVNRPGAVECFGPPRHVCGENSERGCAWAERQWRPL